MSDGNEPPADPFASAKANLRDTVKWLATAFSGLAAVVVAGASLTGVSQLKGTALVIALVGGFFGLLCVILAAGLMLRLLTSKTFFVSDLNAPRHARLKCFLNDHGIDFLPPELPTVDSFLEKRSEAMKQARDYASNPQSTQYQGASHFLGNAVVPLSRLTNLAEFEVLRRNLKSAVPVLFALAIGALLGLGVFAVFSTPPKSEKPVVVTEHGPAVNLDMGSSWGDFGKVFALACGDKPPLKAELLSSEQPGWVRARLLGPGSCAGLIFPLPADRVIPSAVGRP